MPEAWNWIALGETREDPVDGSSLVLSLDVNIQEYAQQAALKVMEEKQAERVSILLMNPQNGEIYACVNVPEFDLNDPFTLNTQTESGEVTGEKKQDLLNQMWRNPCLNDTYEPGSTFKIITMSAGLEAGVVSKDDRFYCPGYKVVEDRRIHCAKRTGHGAQNFVEGAQNSCNPVFIEVGLRLGVERYYKYFRQFGLFDKTGVDLPGEAGTIMHAMKNMGEVELATVSFRAVLPDHSHPAGHNSKFPDQRRKKDYAPFRSVSAEPGWNRRGKTDLSCERGSCFGRILQSRSGKYWKLWYPRDPAKMQRSRVTP